MSTQKDAAVGAANLALAEAGLPGVNVLLAALHSSLWVMDHPDVNAIKFCGNPKEQAKHFRALIAEFFPDGQRAVSDASAVFHTTTGIEP